MAETANNLVSIAEIRAAAGRVAGVAAHTPLLPCPWADPERPLWLKPENFQAIGAFKIRGGYNAIAALPPEVRARGVVTYSSGNHAQAVAYVAREFGVPAVIVMPDVTPAVKVAATRELGAEVVLVPGAQREEAGIRIAAERGLTLVPPYDHRDVIAGQGTAGLEIATDLPDVDVVLVPVSGGGLISGVATAVKALTPAAKVIGVEPELAADARDSLREGRVVTWPVEDRFRTTADGLRSTLSELTLVHIRKHVDDIVTVSEAEIRAAVGVLARRSRIVAEPSGAVTTAAYLSRAANLPAGRTVAVVSGGNIDPALLAELVTAPD